MNPVVVTAPILLPVTLAEAKDQARAKDYADDDDFLNSAISRGTSYVELRTGRALITREYRGFMDCWPWDRSWTSIIPTPNALYLGRLGSGMVDQRAIDIPRPPLQSVTHVITYDDSDVATTLDPASYYVDTASFVGRIVRRNAASWACPARTANGIEIQWIAGYGADSTAVPDNYRHAILLMIDHFYENRSAVVGVEARDSSTPLPLGLDDMVLPDRVYTF